MNEASQAEAAVDQVPDMYPEQANWFLTGDALRYYRMGHQAGLRAAAEAAQANPVECTLDELVVAEIVPARLRLRVGTLEVEASGRGDGQAIPVFGSTVRLDGRPFPVTSLRVAGTARGTWTVEAEFYPRGVQRAHQAAQHPGGQDQRILADQGTELVFVRCPTCNQVEQQRIQFGERHLCCGWGHALDLQSLQFTGQPNPVLEMTADGLRPRPWATPTVPGERDSPFVVLAPRAELTPHPRGSDVPLPQQRAAATPLGLRDIRYERVRCAGPHHPLKATTVGFDPAQLGADRTVRTVRVESLAKSPADADLAQPQAVQNYDGAVSKDIRRKPPICPPRMTELTPEMQADCLLLPASAIVERPALVTAPDEQLRCCALDPAGQRCPKPARYWVGQNGVDDYTHCCAEHLATSRHEGDTVTELK